MSTQVMSGLPRVVGQTFNRYRRRWRFVSTAHGLLFTAALFAGSVGVAVAADRLLRLPSQARLVLLMGIGAGALICMARWVFWFAVRPMGDRQAAIGLGRRFPRMQEDLVSAVELSASDGLEFGVSRSLVASALDQIGRRTSQIDGTAAVSLRRLLRIAAVLLATAAAIAAAYLLRPEAVQNALHRLFRPNSGVPFFCYTTIDMSPGDCVIRTGDAVEVQLKTQGRLPKKARLEVRNKSESLRVTLPCLDGVARWHSGPLFEGISYRGLAGDGRSDWHDVRVVRAPSLSSTSAVLRYPDYTGSPGQTVDSIQGSLEIVEGTSVVVRAAPLARGAEPGFLCSGEMVLGEQRFPLTRDAEGILISAPFVPKEDAECAITLRDGFGLENRFPEGFLIRIVPDGLPRVTVTSPGRDLFAFPGEKIGLVVSAEDEFGLRDLGLMSRVAKGETGRETAGRWHGRALQEGGPQVQNLRGETELNLEELGLNPGDLLEYKAVASDYADDAVFRRAYSGLYRITVLSEAEHLARVMQRLRELEFEIRQRAAEQDIQEKTALQLAEESAKTSVCEAAGRAEQSEFEQLRATESLAEKLEELIPELLRNPSAPVDLPAKLERLARAVRSAAREPMASAAKSFGGAARAAQADQGECLNAAACSAAEAAMRLRQLAGLIERLQRDSILQKLAAKAEFLAARQHELHDATIPVALQTVGRDRTSLGDALNNMLDLLAGTQRQITTGVEELLRDIQAAAESLAFTSPGDAATAQEAGTKLESDAVGQAAAEIAQAIEGNVLLSELPRQEGVAKSLQEVADILSGRRDSEQMEAIVRELDRFIRRQTKLNRDIGEAQESSPPSAGMALGKEQSNLEQDVSEQASALNLLALEIPLFRSRTAEKLQAAAVEMKGGSTDLYASDLKGGLEHGERALALLKEAQEKFAGEQDQMAGACQACGSLRAMLLLQRILAGQRSVNEGTAAADRTRVEKPDQFARQVVGLAGEQSELRVQARRLQQLLAMLPGAAALVATAGEKMDTSRVALQSGDTGEDTRIVQRQIMALLETLLGQCKGCAGGMGLSGARMLAMMGMQGGGFWGGENADILPTALDEAADEEWRKARSQFEQALMAGFEAQYPAEFRDLLTAYFARLRKELLQ